MKKKSIYFEKVIKGLDKALIDIESFSDSYNEKGFVYRYGVFSSNPNEGAMVAILDAPTEDLVKAKIRKLDRRFSKYASPRADIEFDIGQNCWYATYVVCYPFERDNSKSSDWQNFKPLF